MKLQSRTMIWSARAFTLLAALPFLISAPIKLLQATPVLEGFPHLGWPLNMIIPIGILETVCVVLYLIPLTSTLGAILLTGYMGGAIATHLRIGEPVVPQIMIGIFIWAGIFLREPRIRELLPVLARDFKYEREITINRPHQDVFAYLKLLRNFKNWNPFLKKDPQAKLEYVGTDGQSGFTSSWNGNREMGAGEQEITRIIEGQKVEFELRFQKPFRAINIGYFSTEAVGSSQTRVKWGMTGKSPFPMSVIGLFINCEKRVGDDFESGLNQLKTLLEK